MGKPDLNDVTFDAFLANDRTLTDPAVFDVERGAQVRLRLINGSASSNFIVDLGALDGTLVTVDGNPVVPRPVRRFPLAIAQRADIIVRIPSDAAAALPILAVCEGRTLRTGFLLRPRGAAVVKVSETADTAAPALTLADEKALRAAVPLPARRVDRSVPVDLIGDMAAYTWGLQVHGMGGAPVTVDRGERVELVMRNTTMMSHPMHLHGHNFQVDGDRRREDCGRRARLRAGDADGDGEGECSTPTTRAPGPSTAHNLYRMAAGMFTTVVYRGFSSRRSRRRRAIVAASALAPLMPFLASCAQVSESAA